MNTMTNRDFTIGLLLLLCCVCAQITHVTARQREQKNAAIRKPECNVTLFRIIGRQNRYVLACFCTRNKVTRAIARVQTPDFTNRGISLTQDRANIRCILDEKPRLLKSCEIGRSDYNRLGDQVLRQCRKAAPMPGDNSIADPTVLKREECVVTFPQLIADEIGSVVGCVCRNELYEVVTGRAQFFTNAAPNDPGEEVAVLKSCIEVTERQLEEVCRSSPGDFEVLALQLLEVCCKRARVASDAKFQCRAALPTNLDALKVPFAV